jgi:hypothetical protein
MRKFIAITLTTLSAATFIIGAAPAHAADVVPQACIDLGPARTASNTAVAVASVNDAAADALVDSTTGVLNTAVSVWVAAVADHLQELDTFEGNPASTQAILDVALTAVSNALAPWGNAKIGAFMSQHELDAASFGKTINDGLFGQLCAS